MAKNAFRLGALVDPTTGDRLDTALTYEPADLTTHGVIVGMTGSGKTGLGVALIEEAMLGGIPCLVLDPKGDMANLALNFPELAASDFRPWVDEASAARQEKGGDEVAAETATMWSKGLESWGLGPEDMRALAAASPVTIFTPGSTAGVPLNIVGSLAAPEIGWAGNEEILRDEIEGFVSSLLTLAGVDADPVAAPEHILTATIVEEAWSNGRSLDLARLIGAIVEPPIRKLGVFDVDVFFPRKDRTALAMKLNGLVASPAFSSWIEGQPLDIEALLHGGGRPRTAVIYLAHLSDEQRQFVVTLLLSKLVTWMRKQPGTGALRALVYMDEVFGYAPPTAEPPSKKPILTILKQARAFGVGMVLSTQNPVDLDYKAMSNAGTWMIGRLQTERDKARILEGISSATGTVDVAAIDRLISGLGKRAFVLHSTRAKQPEVFTTRWVMSYLAGPMTRDQIARLGSDAEVSPAVDGPPVLPESFPASSSPAVSVAATTVPPPVANGIEVVWTAPSAPWVDAVGGVSFSSLVAPAVAARVHLLYDDHHAGVNHEEEYEAVIHPLDAAATNLTAVDHDDRDFLDSAPAGIHYLLDGVDFSGTAFWRSLTAALTDRLTRELSVTVFKNPDLKLYSRVHETRPDFEERCREAAVMKADQDIAALKTKYQTRIRAAQDSIRRAEHRVRELQSDVEARRQTELLSGAGDLLGAILGGRRGSTGLRQAANRRNQTKRTAERLDTADDRLAIEREQLADLEADLARDVEDIAEKWDGAASNVEVFEIGLERSDVRVEPLRLLWLPVPDRG
ncbi:MAG TPA: DUF87 domain-containing protein [Acidimicrobiia bacterium]|nr:DUF87 domain-containing protein [Acidimicrobiia bacterium]